VLWETLSAFANDPEAALFAILELNSAVMLNPILSRMPKHVFGAYPGERSSPRVVRLFEDARRLEEAHNFAAGPSSNIPLPRKCFPKSGSSAGTLTDDQKKFYRTRFRENAPSIMRFLRG
jgi:hypothetical protein